MVEEKGSREPCSSWTVLHAQSTNALSSGFPLLQGNAEAPNRQGGKTRHRLISYFFSNTSAKNYRNRIVYVKIIVWDVFLRHSILSSNPVIGYVNTMHKTNHLQSIRAK